MRPALSILIPTLESRRPLCEALVQTLRGQAPRSDVQILTLRDDDQATIGQKRNKLLEMGAGRYLCFFDDDDEPSQTYCADILRAIASAPDCVGFAGLMTVDDGNPRRFVLSLDRSRAGRDELYRTPGHLNPIRREIATSVRFPPIQFGEDARYARAIRPHLRSEIWLPTPVYRYRYVRDKATATPTNALTSV